MEQSDTVWDISEIKLEPDVEITVEDDCIQLPEDSNTTLRCESHIDDESASPTLDRDHCDNRAYNPDYSPPTSSVYTEEKSECEISEARTVESNREVKCSHPTGETCVQCRKKTSQTITEKQQTFKCEVCEKCFTKHYYLLKHSKIHSGKKPFNCELCGKAFYHQYHLSRHNRTHTGEKPFTCETCGKAFSFPSGLLLHSRTHSGENPHKCEVCGKRFRHMGNLSKHLRIHTGERPFECENCGKCFSQKGDIVKHARIHTGEKPYKCEICGFCCSQYGNLLKHKRTHFSNVTRLST